MAMCCHPPLEFLLNINAFRNISWSLANKKITLKEAFEKIGITPTEIPKAKSDIQDLIK